MMGSPIPGQHRPVVKEHAQKVIGIHNRASPNRLLPILNSKLKAGKSPPIKNLRSLEHDREDAKLDLGNTRNASFMMNSTT